MSDDLQTARREMEQLRYPEALWSILAYLEAQQQASAETDRRIPTTRSHITEEQRTQLTYEPLDLPADPRPEPAHEHRWWHSLVSSDGYDRCLGCGAVRIMGTVYIPEAPHER